MVDGLTVVAHLTDSLGYACHRNIWNGNLCEIIDNTSVCLYVESATFYISFSVS